MGDPSIVGSSGAAVLCTGIMRPNTTTAVRIRRAHWRDFDAVASLVARCGAGTLVPERRTLRRFRHIVHDLGNDLYLAFLQDDLVGLVHIVFVRELVAPRRAEICSILVSPEAAQAEIGQVLLSFARKRARKRDCEVLLARAGATDYALVSLLRAGGFQSAGEWYLALLQSEKLEGNAKEG